MAVLPWRLRVVCALLLLAGACQACPPEARALVLRPDFSDPVAAGRSFLAAVGCDDARGEYLALGEPLKEEYGATLDVYLLGRKELRARLGSLWRFAFHLEPLGTEPEGDGVLVWWGSAGRRRLGFLMVPQNFFDVTERNGEKRGAFLSAPPGAAVAIQGRRLTLELQDSVLRGLDPRSIARLEVGTEWKIAAVRRPAPSPRPDDLPQIP